MSNTNITQSADQKKHQTMLKHLVQRTRDVQVNIRCTPEQFEEIERRANMFTKGNISEWVRYAASRYEPSESEVA